jgi:hypothetical protein
MIEGASILFIRGGKLLSGLFTKFETKFQNFQIEIHVSAYPLRIHVSAYPLRPREITEI